MHSNFASVVTVFLLLIHLISSQQTCPTAPSNPEDRRNDKTTLSVAEFNAEWLFYDKDPTSRCPGTGCPWHNSTAAMDHIVHISKVIQEVNADIFVLVEIEDCLVLQMVYDLVGDESYAYYLVKGTDTGTGQNVALFTRVDPVVNLQRTSDRVDYPIPGSTCGYDVEGDTGVSKHFWTQFNIENLAEPLILVGAHLIAFPDVPSRCAQREAQATVLRDLVTLEARLLGYSYMILGDLNDFDNTVPDAANDVSISQALPILKSDNSGNVVMTNAASFIGNQSDRWSNWYDENDNCAISEREKSLIDHILLSPDLAPLVATVQIFHDAYKPYCESYYSDHWPIAVYLDLTQK